MASEPKIIRLAIVQALKAQGAQGLCQPDAECGCSLEDFAVHGCVAECDMSGCYPAWKGKDVEGRMGAPDEDFFYVDEQMAARSVRAFQAGKPPEGWVFRNRLPKAGEKYICGYSSGGWSREFVRRSDEVDAEYADEAFAFEEGAE